MSKLFNTTLRINLSDPEGLKAWTYLINRDKSRYDLIGFIPLDELMKHETA